MVLARRRYVAEVALRRILPDSTVFAEESLTSNTQREAWLSAALEKTYDCDLVFLDPDNGLEVPSRPRRSTLARKYAFYDQIRRFAGRGQSLVLYQHFDMAPNLIARRREALSEALALKVNAIHALQYHRGTARVFFVVPASSHQAVIRERLQSFLGGPWQSHFHLE